MKEKVTMRDVAAHAGVSVATVSHVINRNQFVMDETREKVERSIRELHYFPDQMARTLKTGKRNLAGMIVPDIANPVWALVAEQAETALDRQGYKMVIVNTKETEQREIDNIKLLASGIVDGLIIASTLTSFSPIQAAVPADFPMVFIDRTVPDCPCDTIRYSDYDAIYAGVSALAEQGHTRIGCISGLPRLSTSAERLRAYEDAMSAHGLSIESNFIQCGDSMSKSSLPLVEQLLHLRCTALVVSNNVMSDDVLFFLSDHNIRVGQDVCLLGYGIGDQLNYNLRRMDLIAQQSAELGRAAGERLLNRIKHPNSPITETSFTSALLHRLI